MCILWLVFISPLFCVCDRKIQHQKLNLVDWFCNFTRIFQQWCIRNENLVGIVNFFTTFLIKFGSFVVCIFVCWFSSISFTIAKQPLFNFENTIQCEDGCTTESHGEKLDLFSYTRLFGIRMCANRVHVLHVHTIHCDYIQWLALDVHCDQMDVCMWLRRWRSSVLTIRMSNWAQLVYCFQK